MTDATTAVHDHPERHRYVAMRSGKEAGFISYRMQDASSIELVHTEVRTEFEGQGVAGALARHALDDARRRGLRVVPSCSYVAAWLQRHPEYQELVA